MEVPDPFLMNRAFRLQFSGRAEYPCYSKITNVVYRRPRSLTYDQVGEAGAIS